MTRKIIAVTVLFFLLSLFLFSDEIIRYVDTDAVENGNDGTTLETAYLGLNICLATEEADLTDNGGDWLHIYCYASGGTADTTAVVFSDVWRLLAANYILIEVPDADRHDGKWNANKYRLDVADSHVITFADEITNRYVRFEGFQIEVDGTYEAISAPWGDSSAGDLRLSHSIIRASATGAGTKGLKVFRCSHTYIWNNIFYDIIGAGSAALELYPRTDYSVWVYNNTIHNCAIGIWFEYAGTYAICNNIINDCTDAFDTPTRAGILEYNISDHLVVDFVNVTAVCESGTTDDVAANKLIQSEQNFLTTVEVAHCVKNTTDNTYTYVTAVDSDTQLSIQDDIFISGEGFEIYANFFGDVTFNDEGADDFHLGAADTLARGNATDLSGDGDLPVSDDIDGDARAAWDIGADEYVAAGGSIVPIIMQHMDQFGGGTVLLLAVLFLYSMGITLITWGKL